MVASNFDRAFKYTVGHEGGFGNDRRDRGNWSTGIIGKGQLLGTKYGISGMSYPHLDIKNLTLAEAKEIYRKDFWRAIKGDDLPSGLDLVVWDAAVNSGQNRSIRWLQTALGNVRVDGLIGQGTLQAVQEAWASDWEDLLEDTINTRWIFMQGLDTFPIYRNGWRNRILGIGKEARQWAREAGAGHGAPVVPQPEAPVPNPVSADPSSRDMPLPDLADKDFDSIVDMLRRIAASLGLRLTSKETSS
jgi:lysozyme family protein